MTHGTEESTIRRSNAEASLSDVRSEFVDQEQISTSTEVREMPERFQQLFQK